MKVSKQMLQAVEGIEASRRVGWAKYYSAQDETEILREALRQLSDAVLFHPRIHSQDSIVKLAQSCQGL